MSDIAILGSGGFGLALGVMLNDYGHNVTVWTKFQEEIDIIRKDGEYKLKLPGVKISENIGLTTDASELSGKDMLLVGLPTAFVRDVCNSVKDSVDKNTIIVNTSKGLEPKTFKRMSEVLEEVFPENDIVVLTGPSHAEEVAKPYSATTIVAASKSEESVKFVQKELSNPRCRIYTNDDIIGSEIGGALKNVIALCAGIVDGMGLGDNTKAALMTRGIQEIARLGVSLGGRVETFAGLTGIGDLIVTCTSMHSRNRRAGILIGQGVNPEEAVKQVGTVEGYSCCAVAWELCKAQGVSMPITEQLYSVLFENKDVHEAMKELMGRPTRDETEKGWLS